MRRLSIFFFVAVVALGMCMAAQAAVVPMVYNTTTSVAAFDWDMEQHGDPAVTTPVVGSVLYRSGHGVVTGGGTSGYPDAYQGDNMMRGSRGGYPASNQTDCTLGVATAAGDAFEVNLAFRLETATSWLIYFGTTAGAKNLSWFHFLSGGTVNYCNFGDHGGWTEIDGLTHNDGEWNTLKVTHTNGNNLWDISVNGSDPETVVADVDGSSENGNLGGFRLYAGANNTEYFIDAVGDVVDPRFPGDANEDDVVNDIDATIMAANWGHSDPTWSMGDFNNDGAIDSLDAAIMASNWLQTAPAASAVPEPGMLLLLVSSGLMFIVLRKRH